MRLVVQRVKHCSIRVNECIISEIAFGLLVYLGVEKNDTFKDLEYLVNKLSGLRVFRDNHGKMNLSVKDAGGSILVVSQFTICADTKKGFRPSYNNAADPVSAKMYYLKFLDKLNESGINIVSGEFQATMEVSSINDGPVTILLDSRKIF